MCAPCVRANISWHLVYDLRFKPEGFDLNRFPDEYLIDNNVNMIFDCSAPYKDFADRLIKQAFPVGKDKHEILNVRAQKHLPYPINVLRNVARLAATTRYLLASDIELYPSVNIVSMFRQMLKREWQINFHWSMSRISTFIYCHLRSLLNFSVQTPSATTADDQEGRRNPLPQVGLQRLSELC